MDSALIHAMLLLRDMICQTENGIIQLLDIIANKIGIDRVKVIHLNDSKGELGSNLDRHYHIGMGKIGEEGFKFLLNNKKLNNIPFIMETPSR